MVTDKHEAGPSKGGRRSPASGGRRSPNNRGNRSPTSYEERTTTITFVEAETGNHYCTKLNRVEVSAAPRVDGGVLCDAFLHSHCNLGRQCPKVHVPKSYLWKRIEPQVDESTLMYYAGFDVQCYLPDLTRYYTIPSEYLFVTEGAKHYIELYNGDGDNFKEKCFLCPTMGGTGGCPLGDKCRDIHCIEANYNQFNYIITHVATPAAVVHYERMPDSFTIPVFQSNSSDAAVSYAGHDVLRTAGATRYEEDMKSGVVPTGRMQHCAHFQNKKMCRLGDGCRFIHVVSLALNTPAVDDRSNDNTPQRSPVVPTVDGTTAEKRNAVADLIAREISGGQPLPTSAPAPLDLPPALANNMPQQMLPSAVRSPTRSPTRSPVMQPMQRDSGTPATFECGAAQAKNAPQQTVPSAVRSPTRSPVVVPIRHDYSSPAPPDSLIIGLPASTAQRSPTRRNDPYRTSM